MSKTKRFQISIQVLDCECESNKIEKIAEQHWFEDWDAICSAQDVLNEIEETKSQSDVLNGFGAIIDHIENRLSRVKKQCQIEGA